MGWYMYDLAQAIFGVVMLHSAGSPDGSRVDFADEKLFVDRLVGGYESVTNEKVDRENLSRMVGLKKNVLLQILHTCIS